MHVISIDAHISYADDINKTVPILSTLYKK